MFKFDTKIQFFIIIVVSWLVCGVVSAAMSTLVPVGIAGVLTFFYFLFVITEL